MKIAVLNVLHEAFDKRVYHKIIRSLVDAGNHSVVSIVPTDACPTDTEGVHFIPIKAAKTLPDRFLSVFRLIREGRRLDVDAYMAVEPESWIAGLILKFFTGRKLVFDVHEYIPTEFAKFFPRPLRPFMTWLTIHMMRLFARWTDQIILTKECLDRDFKGLKTPRTVVLNTNHLQPTCTEISQELREKYSKVPTLIHQGQFGEVRGAYPLLDAMKIIVEKIPEVQCILLGRFVQGDEQAYRDAIVDAGLDSHMHMIDEVPFEEVPQYIAVADVGLILFQPIGLGHTLGMPHKMFDYMREKKPFIAPDFVLEIARIAAEADCMRLVDVTDPKAIADASITLLQDRETAQKLGETGRKLVEEKYNWRYDEARLLDVFNAIAE